MNELKYFPKSYAVTHKLKDGTPWKGEVDIELDGVRHRTKVVISGENVCILGIVWRKKRGAIWYPAIAFRLPAANNYRLEVVFLDLRGGRNVVVDRKTAYQVRFGDHYANQPDQVILQTILFATANLTLLP